MIFLNEVDDKKLKGVYKQVDKSIRSDKKRKLNDWISINLRDFKLEDGNAYFDDNNDKNDKNFFKILTAKFPVIKKLKEFMDSGNIQLDEELARYLKNKYKQCFDKRAIVKLSGVTVCPYCNRNFINLSSNERLVGRVNNSQLDHFYPKSKYPLFSLSYYNLIPSCFGCNNAKNEEDLLISPYEENLSTEQVLQFDWELISGSNPIYDKNSIAIKIRSLDDKIKKHLELFLLEEQYAMHKDYVQDMLRRYFIYSKEGYENHLKNLRLSISSEDVERMISGAYTLESDYGKRPLSKMLTDIYRKLEKIRWEN